MRCCFPKCSTTGYAYDFAALQPKDVTAALEAVAELAAQYRINLLLGSAVFRGRNLQNCLVVFDRLGRPVHCYAKCQLVDSDRQVFVPGNSIALFEINGVCATAVVCHERRYPELVRLAVMAGAQILFHPNAGMDALSVSRRKRGGRDGIAVRAFENAIFYVFANSVGPQGGGKWSAGDSKIVAPDGRVLRLADNKNEGLLAADLDLALSDAQVCGRQPGTSAVSRAPMARDHRSSRPPEQDRRPLDVARPRATRRTTRSVNRAGRCLAAVVLHLVVQRRASPALSTNGGGMKALPVA